jgi:hypothetical protein
LRASPLLSPLDSCSFFCSMPVLVVIARFLPRFLRACLLLLVLGCLISPFDRTGFLFVSASFFWSMHALYLRCVRRITYACLSAHLRSDGVLAVQLRPLACLSLHMKSSLIDICCSES